jgi:RNA polymerase sigma-70 factor (ECF subfamily)
METASAHGGRRHKSLRPLAPLRGRRERTTDGDFDRLYREHVAEVYQYALAVLANPADAEDVTQQTFLNAYRAFQRGERPRKAHNWLIKIAHNVCRMRWRQSSRRPHEVPLEQAQEPVALDQDRPSLDTVLGALARLPFNQRAAIVMREVEDRSYAEIADVLGTTVPAVEALLFRARTELRSKRKALGVLTLVPVPGSLSSSSFFGGGSGGLAAAGGAVVGTDVALKVAAMVTVGVVAGGLSFTTINAVARSDAAKRDAPSAKGGAQLAAQQIATKRAAAAQRKLARGGFSRPTRQTQPGRAEKSPTNDTQSQSPSQSQSQSGANPEAPTTQQTAAAVTGAGTPVVARATTTVDDVVGSVSVPQPGSTPVPVSAPAVPAAPVGVPTVSAPTVGVPTVSAPTVGVPTVSPPTLPVDAPAIAVPQLPQPPRLP